MTVGLLSLSSVPVLYEGLVASRARMLLTKDITNKQLMGRSAVISTEALSSVRVAFSNFIYGNPDSGVGASATITASIEYPAGTFTQLKFSGSASGTIPDASILFSDYVSVSIPTNTVFWVRQFVTNPNGSIYLNKGKSTFFNEAVTMAASGLTDQTMGGTVTDTNSLVNLPPLAVLGMTVNPSAIVVGDSIAYGVDDSENGNNNINGYNGKMGLITPSLGAVPFLNLAQASEVAQNWSTSWGTARKLMVGKGSHLITQLGSNDFALNSRTVAQVTADLQAIWSLARSGQKIFQCTLIPRSSDPGTPAVGWTTLGQQTAIQPSLLTGLNQSIRAGIAGMTGYYNTASVLESSQDSDLWAAVTPANTNDGTHPHNTTGYPAVVAAGVISPVVWP